MTIRPAPSRARRERPHGGLGVHEELLLIALRDEKGTLESRAQFLCYALGAAVLSELVLSGCVRIVEDRRKLVEPTGSPAPGDPVLAECLGLIVSAQRRRRVSAWVQRFGRLKRLRHRLAEGIARKGVLRDSEETILLLFRRKIYPTWDPTPERILVARLRRAIFGEGEIRDPRTSVLVALAHATGMLGIHFERRELRGRRARLEAIVRGDVAGKVVSEMVRAAQAAVIAAVVTTTTISASS